MSTWVPKDWHIYSTLHRYTSRLLRGSRRQPHNATEAMDSPRSMLTSIVITKGLSNNAGENNCFLNSAVQILWHLDVFRKNFGLLQHHACIKDSCIFCALKIIFTEFTHGDEKVLPPIALRQALALAFESQKKFQLGLMDDAAECFEHILLRMHFHLSNGNLEDNCTVPHCISHQKFAMMLIEQVICDCGETSEPLPFVQLVHYVNAHAIINLAQKGKAKSFGHMLRLAHSDGNLRNQCPNNCDKPARIERTLTNVPDVVSIGIIWDSDNQSTGHVRNFLESIGTQLCLVELFDAVVDMEQATATREHTLVGMVCYYGKHYSAFLLHSKSNCWMSCDDAKVTEIGPNWSNVVEKCCRGRYQPLLFLYQNPMASTISLESIPKQTTFLPSDGSSDGKEAADEKRVDEKLGENSGDASSSKSCGNCNLNDNNNSNALALKGIQFDQGPTFMPGAPPASFSRHGSIPRQSGLSVALPRPSATPSGPSVAPSRPNATLSGPRPSESARPTQAGSSNSLPRLSDSVARHPSSQLMASSNKTGSYSSIPALTPQYPNAPLHRQPLSTARITENAYSALSSPGQCVIPIAGNGVSYRGRYDALPSRPVYVLYNGVPSHPFVRFPNHPLPIPPVMSSHGPSFSNNIPPVLVANNGYGLQTQQPPPSGYSQMYYGGATVPGATVPTAGSNLQATSTSVMSHGEARNQSDGLVEGSMIRSRGPSSEVNLMDWSIIDVKALPSPDSDSISSQYDNLLDFHSTDDKANCQTTSAGVVLLATRNESLTDSYFVVPDAQYLDDMTNGKDLAKEADQLIEQSEAKENSGDMHGALICCNQATNLYIMAQKDPSNRHGNSDLVLKEQRASSRSKRLLMHIEYNQMISKSDVKNKFSATSGLTLQANASQLEASAQKDLLIFSEDPGRLGRTPKHQTLLDNLPQLYSQNHGGSQYHWVSK